MLNTFGFCRFGPIAFLSSLYVVYSFSVCLGYFSFLSVKISVVVSVSLSIGFVV